jgi:hypothetical protein
MKQVVRELPEPKPVVLIRDIAVNKIYGFKCLGDNKFYLLRYNAFVRISTIGYCFCRIDVADFGCGGVHETLKKAIEYALDQGNKVLEFDTMVEFFKWTLC